MTIEPLIQPDCADLASILELFKRIPGRSCTAAAFMTYLDQIWPKAFMVVIRDEMRAIQAFTLAVAPSIVEPKIGWLPFSSARPGLPRSITQPAFKLAECWLRKQGAEIMRYTSIRRSRAMKRAYGVSPSVEVLYEKSL